MVKTILFDWKRTLYNPESRGLIEGAEEVLAKLGDKDLNLYLIGKDPEGSMPMEVERLKVAKWFTAIHFVKDSKADEDIARFIIEPSQTVVVGDRVRSEIEVGNRLGAITVHVAQGKFADELPLSQEQVPTYTIATIIELPELIEQL